METAQELDVKKYIRLAYQKRYLFVAIMVVITSVAIALSYILPKTYEAKSVVLIERNFLNELMKNIAATPSIDDRTKAVSAIMKSRPVVLQVMKELDLDLTRKTEADLEMSIQYFQKSIDIRVETSSSRRDMDMFTVALKHGNPVVARDFINALVRRYIEESLSSKRDDTYGASNFLMGQIDLFKEKIKTIENEIARMSIEKEVISQERLIVLQKKLDDLLTQYTESHPEVVKAKDEIQWQKDQMRGRKRTSDRSRKVGGELNAKPTDQTMPAETGKKKGVLDAGPAATDLGDKTNQAHDTPYAHAGKREKIAALERDRDTYRKIYEELLTALGRSEVSTHIEAQDKGGTFRILEPAVLPQKPVSPDRVRFILFGIVAGLAGGFGILLLLDSMDTTVKTIDNLKAFGLPVLAVIPHMENADEVRRTKQKDVLLYSFTALYYVGVVAALLIELRRGM